MIINAHVNDARATARHLDCLGVTWLAGRSRVPGAGWRVVRHRARPGWQLRPSHRTDRCLPRRPPDVPTASRRRWQSAPSQPGCRRRISSARRGSMPGIRACSQPRRHRAVCATSAEAEASRYSSRQADPRVSVPRWAGSCLLGDVLKDAGKSLSEFADFEPFEVDVLHPGRRLPEKLVHIHALAQQLGTDAPAAGRRPQRSALQRRLPAPRRRPRARSARRP